MMLEAYDSRVSRRERGRARPCATWSVLVRRKEEIAILPKGTHSLVLLRPVRSRRWVPNQWVICIKLGS